MSKREAIVDTCFFNKLSDNGKNIETFKKVLSDLDFKPVVHPYIADNELDVFANFKRLIDEGVVRKVDYSEFIADEVDKHFYEMYFGELYEEMRKYLEIKNSKKQIRKLKIPHGRNIYNYRCAEMSLGDVHIVLMAFFMKLPIVLSEDGDIECLRSIAERKISSDSYRLEIYDVIELIKMIAEKHETEFSKKELQKVVRSVGERARQAEINKIWDENHKST